MKRKALRKDFFMEIRKSMGRFLSIFFIVAIGVAFFSGIRATEPDMRFSGDAYFDEKNLYDIQIMSTLGLTDADIEALKEVKGIDKVEYGYSTDVLCLDADSQKAVHIMSILPTMNALTVEEGRMPEKFDECVVDTDFLSESQYKVGDTIVFSSGTDDALEDTLKTYSYKIVGAVSSPCYIAFQRGNTTIGTGSLSGFVGVPEESFTMDVYTELYASVKGAKNKTAFTDAYTDCVEDTKERVEAIRKEREDARYNEIVEEATGKLNDAKQELSDAKAEADEKLADAQNQLTDGRAQLTDGRAQLQSARIELENSKNQLYAAQSELDTNIANVNQQIEALNQQIEALNAVKDQYNALAASGMTDEQTLGTLQVMQEQIAQGDAQIAAASEQLSGAQAQFDAAQAQINAGWGQIASGEQELTNAEAEIAQKEQELIDAQAEYEDAKNEADEKIADGEREISDAEEEIRKIEHAKWYINDREDMTDYTGYGENADRMRAIGEVFPVLFFLVAALISLTTMTRMVEEQRTQIGTMKALGYERRSIAGKYLGYALFATLAGCVLGVAFGEKIFPYIIITAYGIMYQHIPNIVIPYNLQYALMASGAALACTLLATFSSCYKELKGQAAELMRPPVPKKGKRVFLERVPIIWKNLTFSWKATIRNLVRYKKRLFMTIFGISGCMALLLVGFGLEDSIFNIGVLQYEELQVYDGNLILNEDASREEQDETCKKLRQDKRVEKTAENLLKQVTIKNGSSSGDVYLNVPENVDEFAEFIYLRSRVTKEEYSLNEDSAVLTEKVAKKLGVDVGDTVYIKDDEKGELEVKITAVCENYMYHYLYMAPSLYEKIYGTTPEYNSVYFSVKEGKEGQISEVGETILEEKGALSISYSADIEKQLEDMLSALDIVIVVLVISAGMLAFVVLYNLNNINITERKRELATLKVLGFYPGEVAMYVYRENIILTILGAFVGMALGKVLHQFIIQTVEIDTAMFGRNIDFSSFLYGFVITVAFSVFVNAVMYIKLKKIDMVESLKSVE